MAGEQNVNLKEYIEAVLQEGKLATEMAEREREKAAAALRQEQHRAMDKSDAEREKAASALRQEQHRAMEQAEREREKAAQALRMGLERAMQEGDDRLREHILNQVQQINAALVSADQLEQERIRVVTARLDTQFEAAQEAIKKSEKRYDDKFDQQNEWRGQSADRERSQQETIAKLSGGFLPREVAEAQIDDLRQRIDEVRKLAQTSKDEGIGRALAHEGMSKSTALGIAGIGVAVSILTIIITVVLAVNGAL